MPRKPVTFEIKTHRGLVVMVVVAAFALPAATFFTGTQVGHNSQQVVDNCEGIHRIVEVGSGVIASGRESVEQNYRDGLLTRAQRDRALERVDRQLASWRSADCRPG